ncbi:hypothetical protein ACO0LM_22745 [Undibacterium sp. Di26W]|uniref:hypothetical protein n=1 Tax=Undibacterium sp. Di26W TaxID=3413035 RepID=UPI003BF2786E
MSDKHQHTVKQLSRTRANAHANKAGTCTLAPAGLCVLTNWSDQTGGMAKVSA